MPTVTITRPMPDEGTLRVGDEYEADIDGARCNGIIREVVPLDDTKVQLSLEIREDAYGQLG